jgi:hypothetical protein
VKVIEQYKSDWRPFEPCLENVAIADYVRAWERMADVMRAFARSYKAAEIRVEPPLHVLRTLHGTRPSRATRELRQLAKRFNFGTDVMERGTAIHRRIEQTLHGYKPDLAVIDDWKGYGVPFEMPGTLDAVSLKSSLLDHGPCGRRAPAPLPPEDRVFQCTSESGPEMRIHAQSTVWLGGDVMHRDGDFLEK